MKLALLATLPKLYTHKRFVQAALSRGHEMRILNTTLCYMNISADKPEVHYRGGEVLSGIDGVIPRIGPSLTFYGTAVIRQMEMMGVKSLNSAMAIVRSRDKLRSLQRLARVGVPMPTTGFANSPQETEDLIDMVGGTPLIIKLLEGTQGKGIVLAETRQAARSVIEAFKQLKTNILVQEYIREAKGSDIRCIVLGDQVIAAMERTAKDGEFRANLHRGGGAQPVEISNVEQKMALDAAKAMGLHFAGVDIIRSARGPLVLEINSSPGLEGVEKATGLDIATQVIVYLEQQILGNL